MNGALRTPYSARVFNALLALARRWFPIEGVGISFDYREGKGIVVSADAATDPDHDWKVRCTPGVDDAGNSVWLARIRPGLVNGRDVYVTIGSGDTARLATLTDDPAPQLLIPPDAWRNPLQTGQFITEEDGFTVTAAAAEGYPKFFEPLGVAPAFGGGKVNLDDIAGSIAPPTEDTRTRQIRALDVVLSAPRLASRQDVSVDHFGNATISTSYDNSAIVDRGAMPFRIGLVSKWTPPAEPTNEDQLSGNAIEPTTDELKLATIWIVSPPNPTTDAPDATWTPYAQHFQFYPLNHASPRHLAAVVQSPITLQTGLAGGLADTIFAALLSPVNSANAQVEAYLGAANTRGQFFS